MRGGKRAGSGRKKLGKKHHVTLYLSSEERDALKALARKEGKTVNNYLRSILFGNGE